MLTKTHIAQVHKVLTVFAFFLVLLFSIFSTEGLSEARAQEATTNTPIPVLTETPFAESALPVEMPEGIAGANCSTPVVLDDQWSSGFRLLCQNNFYVLMVDLTNPAIKAEVVAASSGTRTVSSFADNNTIAIINADYQWCASGAICSQGLTISNGSNPTTYTNISHLCSDAKVRREIGFSQDGRVAIDWWYRFVSDGQARGWCGSIPGSGGGLEQYSYNLVGGGPQFTFDGTFRWDCQYGQNPTTHNCLSSGGDVGINGEHFGVGDWWNRPQSAIGYTTDGTVLVLGESNNQSHTMQNVHDIMYQRLSTYGKTLKNAFKFDGGSKAGFWYYNHLYDSTPLVTVPNVIRIQRTNSTCYSLSTNTNPSVGGNISINTSPNCAQGKYTPGTNVQLSASPSMGYGFSNWSGDASGTSSSTTLVMNSNKNVTANFSSSAYTLNITKTGTGSGTVTSNPSGINCGPDCSEAYASGTAVTLTATAVSGSTFTGWSGACSGNGMCTVTVASATTVNAEFAAVNTCPTITDWKGEYWSNDSLSGSPSLCRNDATIDFDWQADSPDPTIPSDHFSARWTKTVNFAGGFYQFNVFHDDGFRLYLDDNNFFENLCTSCRDTESKVWLVPPGNHQIKLEMFENVGWAAARLTWDALYNLAVTKNGPGTGTVTSNPLGIDCGGDCSEAFLAGTVVTLTAIPSPGNSFGGWGGDADCADGEVTMDTNRACTAAFNIPPSVEFDAFPTSGVAPLDVEFHIVDTSNMTSCSWNYGDGTPNGTSCSSYHNHTYTNPGTYTVTFTPSGPGGSSSSTRTNYITVSNPVPTVSSISPTSVTAGGASFALTVNGTNFISTSKVRWNGLDHLTEYVSSTQLTAYVSASDIASAGTANVTVFNPAPGGGTSSQLPFTIQNNLVPDLVVQSITASPTNPVVNQPVTFTVRIKNQGTGDINSAFYVDFYIDSQPGSCPSDGSTYWLVNSLAAGATQDLTYTYDGFSTSGTYNVYAFADSYCYISESNEANNILGPTVINVQPAHPDSFGKSSPANGATNQSLNPTLSWGASVGASSYEYCYDTTNDNTCSNWTSNGTSTTRVLSGLNAGTTYYWHVRSVNSGGTTYSNSSSTAFWSFTTATNLPGAFGKSAPTNGAAGQPTSLTLSWGVSSGATSYEYCYDTTNDSACSNWTSNGASTSKVLSGLSGGTAYYWNVRAVNSGGTTYSNGSSTVFWSFTTVSSLPDLVIESITPVPSNPPIHQPVIFSVVIKNQGSGNAGNFYVDLFAGTPLQNDCSGQGQISYPVNGLAAGATQTLTLDFWEGFGSSGNQVVSAMIDTTCQVSETDEGNNTKSTNLAVDDMVSIFADGFESGNLNRWPSSITDNGDLIVTGAAKSTGNYGVQALIDDNAAIFANDDSPSAETDYLARFSFDPNSITMANGDTHLIFGGYSGSSTLVLRVQFRKSSGNYQVQAALLNDGSGWTSTNWVTINDSYQQIQLDWKASTGVGANNGGLTLWINEVPRAELASVDNDTRRIDRVRLGAVNGIDSGTRGTTYFDDFFSFRSSGISSQPPDLIIQGITHAPANPQKDQPVTFYVDIKNQGSSTATNFWLTLNIDVPVPGCGVFGELNYHIDNLASQASQTLTIPYDGFVAAGNHTINGIVDSQCQVSESIEGNNSTLITVNVTEPEPPGASIFADDFESGDISQWTSCTTDGGDLSVTPAARHAGNYGMQTLIDDNTAIYCTSDSPHAETRYRASFRFHPNNIPMSSGNTYLIFSGYSGTSTLVMRVQFRKSSGNYQVQAALLSDGSSWRSTSWQTISGNSYHLIELDWKAARGAGANNGSLIFKVDGNQLPELTGVDNDTRRIDRVRLGAVNGIDSGTRGTTYFDDFASDRGDVGPQPTSTLTVGKTGTGSGTVTSSPAGISCGSDCSETYSSGTTVTLTAAPASGSIFTGWSGGGCSGTASCTVTLNANSSVTANFDLQGSNYTLSVNKAGTGSGSVTSNPAGINCGSDCSEAFAPSTSVTLTAVAASGSTFAGWSGGGCSGIGSCTVTMSANTSVTATFSGSPPTDVIFADSFESGDLSQWTSCTVDSGDLSVTTAAKHIGNYGMQALLDDNVAIYCTSDHPNAEPRYRARFYFDPNSISMMNGDAQTLLRGYSGSSTIVLRVEFGFSAGGYQIRAALLNDGSTWTDTAWVTLTDEPHAIELDWRAGTASGANDGGLTLWVDGVQQANVTGIDNDTRRIDRIWLGASAGIDTGTRGTYYFDAFESRRQTYIGP